MDNLNIIDILSNVSIVPIDEHIDWKGERKYQSAIFVETDTLLTFCIIDKLIECLQKKEG